MKENLRAFSKLAFESYKAAYEAAGYKVISRWRKGLKHIRLADIVLGERGTVMTHEKRVSSGALDAD